MRIYFDFWKFLLSSLPACLSRSPPPTPSVLSLSLFVTSLPVNQRTKNYVKMWYFSSIWMHLNGISPRIDFWSLLTLFICDQPSSIHLQVVGKLGWNMVLSFFFDPPLMQVHRILSRIEHLVISGISISLSPIIPLAGEEERSDGQSSSLNACLFEKRICVCGDERLFFSLLLSQSLATLCRRDIFQCLVIGIVVVVLVIIIIAALCPFVISVCFSFSVFSFSIKFCSCCVFDGALSFSASWNMSIRDGWGGAESVGWALGKSPWRIENGVRCLCGCDWQR